MPDLTPTDRPEDGMVPCKCKPGDGSVICPWEDDCLIRWMDTGTAEHADLPSPDAAPEAPDA